MLDYWWVTRPKRSLTTVPSVLATIVYEILNQSWHGARETHVKIEEALENAGVKRAV